MPRFPSASLSANLRNLPFADKLIAIGSLAVLIACFFPWYEYARFENFTQKATTVLNAFSGDTAVVGYCIFIFATISFSHILFKILGWGAPRLPFRESARQIFLGAEGLFLAILLLVIFNSAEVSFSRGFVESGVSFGLYLSIIGEIVLLLGARFLYLDEQTDERRQAQTGDEVAAHFSPSAQKRYAENLKAKAAKAETEEEEIEEGNDPRMKLDL